MEIVPGVGFGELHFGMSKSDAFARLGFPNKSRVTESGDREVQYFARRLVLKFESGNDDRLGWIEVHDQTSTPFGTSPWSLPKAEVLALFASCLGEVPEFEDYGSFESYTFSTLWVELQFAFGTLSCINFGVPYDDQDNPIWPKQD